MAAGVRRGFVLGAAAVLLVACSAAEPQEATLEGELTGIVQFGGEGNSDGLVNAKACNEDRDVDDYYKVTTYSSAEGQAGDLGTVRIELAHCNSPDGPQQGQIGIVTEGGEELFGEYSAEYDGAPIDITFMAETSQDACYLLGADDGDIECRGTGVFSEAEGTAALRVSAAQTDPSDPFVPWSFDAEWVDGTVTYAAE
jgi:hypothetical protein